MSETLVYNQSENNTMAILNKILKTNEYSQIRNGQGYK